MVHFCCKKSYSFRSFIYTATLEKTVMSASSSVHFSYNGVI